MNTLSPPLLLTVAALCGAAFLACSDDEKPGPGDTGDDAGAGGGVSAGGAASGGAGPEAGAGGATEDAGAGGAAAGGAAAGGAAAGGAAAGGAAAGGAGGSDPCDSSPFRCSTPYPAVPHPAENPFDPASAAHRAKAMLGKVLFWEEQIGELGTMACGTCHRAMAGGSDPRAALPEALKPGLLASTDDDVRGGMGVPKCEEADGGLPITDPTVQVTGRKPPTYLDAMFGLEIFWDGRAGYCRAGEAAGGCFYDPDLPGSPPIIRAALDPVTNVTAGGALEAQAVGPPVNDVEMACARQTWSDIHEVLRTATPLVKATARPMDMEQFITDNGTSYPQMFAAAFGDEAKVNPSDPDDVINTRRIAFAIATHERNLTSNQTPWDRWNAGDDSALTPRQVQGFELFMNATKGKCSTCHMPPLFTNNAFHYIGFHHTDWDPGRAAITGRASDVGMAKTPTLRNVGLREAGGLLKSGAGPGTSLETVMALYKTGGAFRSDPVAGPFIDGSITTLDLTQEEIDAIVDFMRNGLTDPRVQNETAPFDRPRLSTEIN